MKIHCNLEIHSYLEKCMDHINNGPYQQEDFTCKTYDNTLSIHSSLMEIKLSELVFSNELFWN